MCGRFSQALPAELLVRMFGAIDLRLEAPAPSWNVAPTAQVTTVGWDRERARRVIVPMTWGLLASWEKHPDAAKMKPINARCETVATSRMFAPAFRQRRILVPIDAWYEWAVEGGQKIPHALGHSDRSPVVLGGIWECWPVWLGEVEGDPTPLLRPAPSGRITTWRVGRAVGNPRNNGAQLLAAA